MSLTNLSTPCRLHPSQPPGEIRSPPVRLRTPEPRWLCRRPMLMLPADEAWGRFGIRTASHCHVQCLGLIAIIPQARKADVFLDHSLFRSFLISVPNFHWYLETQWRPRSCAPRQPACKLPRSFLPIWRHAGTRLTHAPTLTRASTTNRATFPPMSATNSPCSGVPPVRRC